MLNRNLPFIKRPILQDAYFLNLCSYDGLMQSNAIHCEDCITGMSKLPSGIADLIIADPPYYKTINEKFDYQWRTEADYLAWCEQWLTQCQHVAKRTASLYVFGYFRTLCYLVPIAEKCGFELRQQIIIDKGMRSIAGRHTRGYKMFPTTTESLLYFIYDNKPFVRQFLLERQKAVKKTAKEINTALGVKTNGGGMWTFYTGDNVSASLPTEEAWIILQDILQFDLKYRDVAPLFNIPIGVTDVWRDVDFYLEKRVHSAQKPLALIKRLILASSQENDLVIDPFCGSGTVPEVCRQYHRKYVGFETDPKYHKIAINRIRQPLLRDFFRKA